MVLISFSFCPSCQFFVSLYFFIFLFCMFLFFIFSFFRPSMLYYNLYNDETNTTMEKIAQREGGGDSCNK